MTAVERSSQTNFDLEEELVCKAQNGDNSAFGELMRRNHGLCLKLAIRILRNSADAEDAVQEAGFKALRGLAQYRGDAPFSMWLRCIVRNECLMLWRNRKRAQSISLDGDGQYGDQFTVQLPAPASDPESSTIEREQYRMMHNEIGNLPVLFRTVLVLRDVDGRSMDNIAKHLGTSVGAAKSRLLRARNELGKRVDARARRNGSRMPAFSAVLQ